tara:strand:- start:1172 stop:1303 length:132 start_codon:yes stop_codon:yes gene_type:complete
VRENGWDRILDSLKTLSMYIGNGSLLIADAKKWDKKYKDGLCH